MLVNGELVWSRENAAVVQSGEGSEALLLSDLLRDYPGKTTLLVTPCMGAARRFSTDEIQQQPERYSIHQNSRGLLKLVDEEPPPGSARLQLKNLYSMEILD